MLFLNDKPLDVKIISQGVCRTIFPSIKQMLVTIILFKEFAQYKVKTNKNVFVQPVSTVGFDKETKTKHLGLLLLE